MTYLIIQTFILLLIAGLLGLVFGWYLTRIAAASARVSLLARLLAAENDARELRAELDAAAIAKRSCDTERRLLSDELADMRARQDAAAAAIDNGAALAAIQAELDQCRMALAEAVKVPPGESVSAPQGRQAPMATTTADTDADDLQRIKGIGPKIAGTLKELGIRRFAQIAAWTPDEVERVNQHLRFKGRVEREEWIAQARAILVARASS